MTYSFFAIVDDFCGYRTTDEKFYPSIDSAILDGKMDDGYILDYVFIPEHTTVPILTRTYEVSTIEYYELHEFLEDSPEMNENNYLVYTVEKDGEPDMLTIISLYDNRTAWKE